MYHTGKVTANISLSRNCSFKTSSSGSGSSSRSDVTNTHIKP